MTIKHIQARFTSGNEIPINKAMVPADEWRMAMVEIQVLKDQFIWDKSEISQLQEQNKYLYKKLEDMDDSLKLQTLHFDTLAGALEHLTKKLKEENKLDQYCDLRDVFDLGKQEEMTDEAWRQLTQVIPFRLREVMKGHLHSIEVLHESLNKVASECLDGYGWSLSPWASTGQYGVAVEAAAPQKSGAAK